MLQNLIRFLSILMLAMGLAGCHDQFRSEWQQAARVCGLAPDSITDDEVLVQLQTPEGQNLEPEHVLTIRSRFLESGRSASEVTLSPGGCAHVPSRNGVLQVVSGTFGWSLAEPLQLASADRRLLQKRLSPSPQAEAELQCPEEGFFVDASLDFPLRWNSTGSLQPFRMELVAEDEAKGTSVQLFEKPYGENLPSASVALDTRVLAEGRYVMKLNFSSSTEGWDQPRLAPAKKGSCPLTVLHHPPLVGGWDSATLTENLPVYAKNSILPWHSSGPESQLLVCREKRGSDQDTIGSARIDDVQCPAQNRCKDPQNFEAVTKVVTDEPGVFDYFLTVKNKAGIRSSPRCRTIIVSDSKPKLTLSWKNLDWNRALTHMQLPHATVSLTMSALHAQLDDRELSNRLECRADFIRADQSVLPGKDLLCLSGRCEGRSLETFQPCDASLSISLAGFWKSMQRQNGFLRVIARLDDGAGHVEEASASIGIQPERWLPLRKGLSLAPENSISGLLQDSERRIFLKNKTDIKEWNSITNQWNLLPRIKAGTVPLEPIQFWLSASGELVSEQVFATGPNNAPTAYLARWDGVFWNALPLPPDQPTFRCLRPQMHPGGFWCQDPEGRVQLFDQGQWLGLDLPVAWQQHRCVEAGNRLRFARDGQQHFWLACDSEIYHKASAGEPWLSILESWPDTHGLPLLGLGLDAGQHAWLAFGNQPDNLMILRGEGGQLQRVGRPELMPWKDVISRDFLVTPRGQVILGPNIWDKRTEGWQPIHELAEIGFQQHMTPDVTDQGELYWTTGQGLIQSGPEGLRYWDSGLLGLQKIGHGSKPVFEPLGLWVAANEHGGLEFPYYVNVSPWLLLRRPTGFPDAVISNFWLTNGQPRIYVPGDGLYQHEATGWTKLMASPQLDEKRLFGREQFDGYAFEPQGLHQFDPETLQWKRIHTFTKYFDFKGGLKDQQGRIWIYEPNHNEAGFIEGNKASFTDVVPGVPSVHLHGLYSLQNSIHTSSSQQLLRYDEATGSWVNERRWSDEGLAGPIKVVQADAETLLVQDRYQPDKPEGLWLFKPASGETSFLPIPNNGTELSHAIRNARGDLIITIDYDIHLVENGTGKIRHLFSRKDLKNLFKEEDKEIEYISLIMDAENRLWININKGLLMIHLP